MDTNILTGDMPYMTRQAKVLELAAEGRTRQEIADITTLPIQTVGVMIDSPITREG